jgi:KDO2-lipid IV(A) lauroyltransferase
MKYYILYFFSLLPLKVLYLFRPLVFFWLSNVLKYRKDVIIRNLNYVYEHITQQEIDLFVKNHYQYLSNFLIESLKTLSISKKSLEKRIQVIGKEKMIESLKERPVLILSSHHSNWNWAVTLFPTFFSQPTYVVYEPFMDLTTNKILTNIRSKLGGKLISIFQLISGIKQIKEKEYLLVIAADNCPDSEEKKQWQVFLNKETLFFKGFSQIAKSLNMDIFFMGIKTIQKGGYEIVFEKLETENFDNEEITLKYINWLEKQIFQNPTEWFWYHKRWKFSKDGNIYETKK